MKPYISKCSFFHFKIEMIKTVVHVDGRNLVLHFSQFWLKPVDVLFLSFKFFQNVPEIALAIDIHLASCLYNVILVLIHSFHLATVPFLKLM